MVGWAELYFFELVLMRMSGFVLFNPILGRSNIPGYVKAGVILVLSVFVYSLGEGAAVQPPGTLAELAVIMLLELAVGFVLGFLMHLSNAVVHVGGEVIDAQMGLSMAQTYDAGSQINMTITGSLLNVLFVLNFFLENGHYTLMRILLTSAEVLPYGTAALGEDTAVYVVEIFCSCMVLAVKLAMPILAAELLGEIGMGILMKAIPQINAFVINIELKVIIGLVLLFLFLVPINEFLLEVEQEMLLQLRQALTVLSVSG